MENTQEKMKMVRDIQVGEFHKVNYLGKELMFFPTKRKRNGGIGKGGREFIGWYGFDENGRNNLIYWEDFIIES